MKHIVVPTDFSENALKAARFALSLARDHQASITIIHAYQPFRSGFQSETINERDEARAKEEAEVEMKNFLEMLKSAAIGGDSDVFATVNTQCLKGNIVGLLNELNEQKSIDLIVMGTTGASGLKYQFLGSNTFDVVKKTTLPLLVVPPETEVLKVDNIIFFTDYQPQDSDVLAGLVSIFGTDGVQYKLVHIHDSGKEIEDEGHQKLEDWAAQLQAANTNVRLSFELAMGKEREVVEAISKRNGASLLALTMYDRTFWDRLLHKSLAKAVVLQSHTPVFIRY